jgi:transposase
VKRFVEGDDRKQVTLLPECLDDFVAEDDPVRIIEAFVEELKLESMGFDGVTPAMTGRPSYHPAVLLKIYIYGYLNRIQSSRRLERECQRNVELMWLTGRLVQDFKTIADFRAWLQRPLRCPCGRMPWQAHGRSCRSR